MLQLIMYNRLLFIYASLLLHLQIFKDECTLYLMEYVQIVINISNYETCPIRFTKLHRTLYVDHSNLA